MKPTICKWLVPLAILGIPLFFAGLLINNFASHIAVPRQLKLVDYTNGTVHFDFTAPKGNDYYFELTGPKVSQMPNGTTASPYAFTGRIQIVCRGVKVADFVIASDQLILTSSGFNLTGRGSLQTNKMFLNQLIRPQEIYTVDIIFDPPPLVPSSIWLHWIQQVKDSGR